MFILINVRAFIFKPTDALWHLTDTDWIVFKSYRIQHFAEACDTGDAVEITLNYLLLIVP